MGVLDIAEYVEAFIREKGAEIAFPVNISFNQDAAHDTAAPADTREIRKEDVVKIDIGVMVDGYIADSAFTFSFDPEHTSLIKASAEALKAALDIVRPGITPAEIGKTISDTIRSLGFSPVENLTGHGLGKHKFHTDPTIPNVPGGSGKPIPEGSAIAIEPFATTGTGKVRNSSSVQIFSLFNPKPARTPEERRIMNYALAVKRPFSLRELKPRPGTKVALMSLVSKRMLVDYPVLTEVSGGLVSQSEHTVIVMDEPIITTL